MITPMTRLTFLLLFAALAPPFGAVARAESSPPISAVPPQDNETPPPASADDLALWRAAQSAGEAVVGERTRAMTLQTLARNARLLDRLEAAALKAEPKASAELSALRQKLLTAWQRDYEYLVRRWPVDATRVCWVQRLAFDSQLRDASAARTPAMAQARGETRECVEKAMAAVKVMAAANDALEAASAEAARVLGPPPEAREAPGAPK